MDIAGPAARPNRAPAAECIAALAVQPTYQKVEALLRARPESSINKSVAQVCAPVCMCLAVHKPYTGAWQCTAFCTHAFASLCVAHHRGAQMLAMSDSLKPALHGIQLSSINAS